MLIAAISRTAFASEDSLVATARGVDEFHAERYAEALAHFERAVTLDERDIAAWYYRGVTRARLDQHAAAVPDLRHVVDRRPEHRQAALELGIALVRSARPGDVEVHEEALQHLERAAQEPALATRAAFFLGLAELRLLRPRVAVEHFRRAGADPSQASAARYYEGLASVQMGDDSAAEAIFTDVVQRAPGTEVAREAERYVAWLHERGAKRTAKRYRLYGSAGFEYDSNVVLAPDAEEAEDALAISDQGDGRATLLAGGSLEAWKTNHVTLALGYEFFQSLHFDLDEFDVQDHRPTVELTARFEHIELGVVGRYDYYRLGSDSLLHQATALPWLRIREGELGHLDVYYRMRARDYLARRFAARLDGVNHAAALVQEFSLGGADRYAWVGYRFDHQGADHSAGDVFAYDGHQAETGLRWMLDGPPVAATVSYAYRHEDYDAASRGRRDEEHHVGAGLEWRLTDHLATRVGYMGRFNQSNVTLFEYGRHIGTIALDVSF